MYICIHIYIYIHIDRERKRDTHTYVIIHTSILYLYHIYNITLVYKSHLEHTPGRPRWIALGRLSGARVLDVLRDPGALDSCMHTFPEQIISTSHFRWLGLHRQRGCWICLPIVQSVRKLRIRKLRIYESDCEFHPLKWNICFSQTL